MTADRSEDHWDEETSRVYLDYGRYFVPQREQQMRIMIDLLVTLPQPLSILELCCGEGLLAEMLLNEFPDSTYIGLDGSPLMLDKAGQRLSGFGERIRLDIFELGDRSWRKSKRPVQAILSSLAIHHLIGGEKQLLFRDVFGMLAEGGVFIVADMVKPATPAGMRLAADSLDELVRQRSMEMDGNTNALDFFSRERWNTFRYFDPDDIDHPSRLFDQMKWLEQVGFENIDVHFFLAGHALFSGWKSPGDREMGK